MVNPEFLMALRADREVVLKAIARNGAALQHASAALRADHEVVLAAIAENPTALGYADREVVLQAVQRNPQSLDFAAPSVTCCSDFWLLALAADIPKIAAFPHDILNMGKHCNWGYRSLLLAASREKELRPARTAPFEPFEAAQPATAAPAAVAEPGPGTRVVEPWSVPLSVGAEGSVNSKRTGR